MSGLTDDPLCVEANMLFFGIGNTQLQMTLNVIYFQIQHPVTVTQHSVLSSSSLPLMHTLAGLMLLHWFPPPLIVR